ncbi:hypothetical protein PD280_08125 [Virgibacillus salarius]|uniref:hypothetical protein n=1 Tax=Virgibacillus salarius TaxID=447199 RepID=UPI000422E53F|nr:MULTISPECIES: hypothetical protein [Bacillaceae]WBX81643.1 hypothetical protein PD280_08125 [Virgibacillus salarius]
MLTNYDSTVFDNLNELDIARKRFLDKGAEEYLLKLGEVVHRHGLTDVVGITMAHRHFRVRDGEQLVEEVRDNSSVIKPLSNLNNDEVIPFTWKLSKNKNGNLLWYPLEFVKVNTLTEESINNELTLRNSYDFLNEFSSTLIELGLEDIFGLCIVHREFQLSPNEMLVESLEEESRTLSFNITPRQNLTHTVLIPTFWRFDKKGKALQAEAWKHCIGH